MSTYYQGRIAAKKLKTSIVLAMKNNALQEYEGVTYMTETFGDETYFIVLRSSTRGTYQKINDTTADLSQPLSYSNDESVWAYTVPHSWALDDQPDPVYIEAGEQLIVEDSDESGYGYEMYGHYEVMHTFNIREFYLNHVAIGHINAAYTTASYILAELLRDGYIRPAEKSVLWQVPGTMQTNNGGLYRE